MKFKNEKEIYSFWEKSGFFKADPSSSKKSYSLLTPPPNLTGELHLGHAMQHSILDAIARFKRMQSFDVLLLPGVDHAGILFEATLDKELSEKGLSKAKLGREEWLKRAWGFKEKVYQSVSSTWRFMGLSADWSREVFTLGEGPQKAVYEEFKTFFDRGLIYKGPYIVEWCPKCNTAIEDIEMDYEERDENLYTVRYLIESSKDEYIEVATTRPETIFADTGIAIYPNHPRYKKYVGKKAHVPLPTKRGQLISIFEDDRVDKDFGTGALKITPGHDLLDWQIGKDHKLPTKTVINKQGKMTDNVGKFAGLSVNEGRHKSLQLLTKNGSLIEKKQYKHSVAICDRCKSVVEPLISEEWFVRVNEIAKGAIKVIKEGKINFLPKQYAKILTDWLLDIHDWCISRSLWWGHRIPIWYCTQCNLQQDPFKKGAAKVSLEKPKKACALCGGINWQQDAQVLDTWFSSGLWPLSTLGWPNDKSKVKCQKSKALLKRYYPWDFEITAPDIKYLWIARMIMLSQYFMHEIPFKTMFFHGMLRDLLGRKFSKSLGNGIEPTYLIEKWGVDATRMALYTYSIPGRDGRVSRELLDERGKNFRNFATKVRNMARFILELKPAKYKTEFELTHSDDKWISGELTKTVRFVTKNLEQIKLHLASEEIYEFIWHKFADIYLEKSKIRRKDAQPVLEHVFKTILILLHPFMPFLTEELYQKFERRKKSIMLEGWPHS